MKAVLVALALLVACNCGGNTPPPVEPAPPVYPVKAATPELEFAIAHTVRIERKCVDDDVWNDIASAVDLGNGTLLTAAHVVDDDETCDYKANTVGVVVLRHDTDGDWAYLMWEADTVNYGPVERRAPVLGESVYVVGFPADPNDNTQRLRVSVGVVSVQGWANRVGFTAPAFFGNSGGGVWGTDGALLGVVSSLYQLAGIPYDGWYWFVTVP